jgi:hypothetical protein
MRVIVCFVVGLAAALEAQAQEVDHRKLAGILPSLILEDITLPRPAIDGVSHQAHFSPLETNELNNPAVGIVEGFNKLMMVQLSSFPLGSSAGGFTYAFDESLGTFRRGSSSFGPSFAERAVTIGRRKLNAGVTYQRTKYKSFEGQNLDGGAIKFYLRHEECCTAGGGSGGGSGGGGGGSGGGGGGPIERPNGTRLNPAFEGDLIEAALSLSARTDTLAFLANYGLTSRWDVGVVVPLVRVDLDASVRATILRLATDQEPLLHTFEEGNPQATQRTFRQSGTAAGLGDVLLRSKYLLRRLGSGGLSGGVDLRLPTGDKQNLLGAGTQVKMLFIASGGTDRLLEHINIGYTAATGDVERFTPVSVPAGPTPIPHEVNYAGGVEFVATPRLTLIGDVVGRTLRDTGRLAPTRKSFSFQSPTGVQTAEFDEFESKSGSLHLVLGTAGVKFNPFGNWLVYGSVLFPLTDTGLRSRVTTVVGLDYAF